MHEDCYFCVKRDICTKDVPKPCRYNYTEDQRKADQASDQYGAILNGMYLPKTYQKKEDDEMKATSVQNIENVKDICISAAAFPMRGPGETLTIVIYTDDDVFEFNFEGSDLVQKFAKSQVKLEEIKKPTIEYFSDEEPADNVNHPSHYTGKYECIDVMQDVFGDEATNNFCLCNAFKYIWRARKKNGLEDVKKAVWYLKKYIEEAEKDGEDEITGT